MIVSQSRIELFISFTRESRSSNGCSNIKLVIYLPIYAAYTVLVERIESLVCNVLTDAEVG